MCCNKVRVVHNWFKKFLCFIFSLLDCLICFFLAFKLSSDTGAFAAAAVFVWSRTVHSHSGYSESSKATGSLPVFLTLRLNGVPAKQDDLICLASFLRTTELERSLFVNNNLSIVFIV